MNRNLPLDIRAHILLRAEAGDKYSKIVENVSSEYGRDISKGTITKLLDKYEETKTLLEKSRPGRPNVLDQMDEEAIIKAVEDDPKLTATDVFKDSKLSSSGASLRKIQYSLRNDGLLATTTQSCQLTSDAIQKRLAFANEYMNKPESWQRIIFSDESGLFPFKAGKGRHSHQCLKAALRGIMTK